MEENEFDVIIVGGGPAGLSASIYTARAGLKTLILDSLWGGQAIEIVEIENYPGVFPKVSGITFVQNLIAQVKSFGVVMVQSRASCVKKDGNTFSVETSSKSYRSRAVILASGASHKKLRIAGEKEFTGRGISYCAVCDGNFFRNRDVVVAGGGDSAFSQAIYLSQLCSHVSLLHYKEDFKAAPKLLQKASHLNNLEIFQNHQITELRGKQRLEQVVSVNNSTGQEHIFNTDGLFVFIGMEPSPLLIEGIGTDQEGYVTTDIKMRTNIPGLFAAGDLRSKSIRQVITASRDGVVAAMSAYEFLEG